MKTLETIRVVLEATSEPLKKTIQSARKEMERFARNADSQGKRAGNSFGKAKEPIKKVIDSVRDMNERIRSFSSQMQLDAGVKRYTDEYMEYSEKVEQAREQLNKLYEQEESFPENEKFRMSDEFKEVQEQAKETENRLEQLKAKKEEMDALGISKDHWSYEETVKSIKEAESELKYLNGEMDEMRADGTDKTETEKWNRIREAIRNARNDLRRYQWQKMDMEDSGEDTENASHGFSSGSYIQSFGYYIKAAASQARDAISSTLPSAFSSVRRFASNAKSAVVEVIKEIPFIGRFITESSYLAKKGFSMIAFAASKVGAGISKAGGAAAALIKRFSGGIPVIGRFMRENQKNGNALSGGLKGILKYGLGIRSLFTLMNKLRSSLVSGFNELSKYSEGTNENLSLLSSQLSQLKNSLAAAFEPILSVVTPILSRLIDHVLTATNALAQFFSALTGKSSYNTAKRVNKDYAASLDSSADSAKKANKENEKLKRTLMGFDEINKLDEDSNSSSETGSSSNAGTSFATETVENNFSNISQMVKDAWKNADFTEIGMIVGTKINEALKKIPWSTIQETAQQTAKSIATFLNGAINGTDWTLAGKTIAEGLNTAIGFGYTFVTTFDWSAFGTSIGEGINGLFDNLDWEKAGETISEYCKGIYEVIEQALETTDWEQVGKDVGTFLSSIDWVGCLASVGTIIMDVLIGALELGDGLFQSISDALQEADWNEVASEAWELFKKAWNLVRTALSVAVSLVKSGWTTIKSFVGGAVTVSVSLAKKGWKKLTEWIGGLTHTLSLKLPNIKVEWSTKKVAGFEIKYPSGFKTYATGGFPEEGPFYMNRGEIAGKFSNGKGVVANNQQITAGIANAVGPAVYHATRAAIQEKRENNRIVVTLETDAKGIFRIVKTEAQKYADSHGTSPFPV